jgi:DNA repair protein RAD16
MSEVRPVDERLQVGVRCVKLDGSMTMEARRKIISEFNEDPNVPCFLMSLKAGGVALNLTVASHVMLMDPWWNPAVEQQAQDRIHRLGQFKPITVTRFVIAGTVEERILKLQEKKNLIFEGTVGGDTQVHPSHALPLFALYGTNVVPC